MSSWLAEALDFAARHGPLVRVTVIRAFGSVPREVGAAMLVSRDVTAGTIGGGALEHAAIAEARRLHSCPLPPIPGEQGRVRGSRPRVAQDLRLTRALSPREEQRGEGTMWPRIVREHPLGPELAQCCGGYVGLLYEAFGTAELEALAGLARRADGRQEILVRPVAAGVPPLVATSRRLTDDLPLPVLQPVRAMLSGTEPMTTALVETADGDWLIEPTARRLHPLYLYGAGHVGRAVAKALADLPFKVVWVDTAADRFPVEVPRDATATICATPARVAADAPAGAMHLVMTFSHALDLEICRALLARNDFGHLGLIGSATKRARFLKRLGEAGVTPGALARLECPIGIPGIAGKEPAMIAASVAARLVQLVDQLASAQSVSTGKEHSHGR